MFAAEARSGSRWGSLQRSPDLLAGSAGLTIVPVLSWEEGPAARGPRQTLIFYHAVLTSERLRKRS